MALYCFCCHPFQLALFLFVFMPSSLLSSSLFLHSTSKEINWNCVIKENKNIVNQYDYYFNLDLSDMGSLNMSQLKFRMETCDAQVENLFCADWDTKDIYHTCRSDNISKGVFCEISEIDATKLKTDTHNYAIFAQYNSTYTLFKNNFGLISYLPCECKDFSFNPNLNISVIPLLGEAEINIKPFLEPKSDILDFDLTITPNKSVVIKKDGNKFQYQLSKLDPCQQYSADIELKLKDTTFKQKCKNDWKMNPGIIEFRIPELEMDEVSCSYNLTHINLTPTATLNSPFYYNLSIGEESFMGNFTNNVSFALRRAANLISKDLSGLVSLCARSCNKCGIKRPVKCYSSIHIQSLDIPSKDSNKTSSFLYKVLIISIVSVGILFAVISTALWIRYSKRKAKSMDSYREALAPRHSDPSSNNQLRKSHESDFVEPASPDPTYEEIIDYHVYDQPDLKLDHSLVATGLGNRKEQSKEFLEGGGTHSEEKMFLFCPENELTVVA